MKYRNTMYQCAPIFLVLIVMLPLCSTAMAQNEARLVLKTEVAKEISMKEGNASITKYEPVLETGPGDILLYTVTYHNKGDSPAKSARIVDPIPEGTVYIMESASGIGTVIQFSIDEGATWQSHQVMHVVMKPDGSMKKEIAPPEIFTHIRWLLTDEVPAGGSGTVSFKVNVK